METSADSKYDFGGGGADLGGGGLLRLEAPNEGQFTTYEKCRSIMFVTVVPATYLLLNCAVTSDITRKVLSHFGVLPTGGS